MLPNMFLEFLQSQLLNNILYDKTKFLLNNMREEGSDGTELQLHGTLFILFMNMHEAQQFPGIYILLHDHMRQTLYLKIWDKYCITLKLKQTLINIIFQDKKYFDILFELWLMFKPSEMNGSQSSKEILFDLDCIIFIFMERIQYLLVHSNHVYML